MPVCACCQLSSASYPAHITESQQSLFLVIIPHSWKCCPWWHLSHHHSRLSASCSSVETALYSDILFTLLLKLWDIKPALSALQVSHWIWLKKKKKENENSFLAALKSSTFFAQLLVLKVCRILLAGTRAQEGGREDEVLLGVFLSEVAKAAVKPLAGILLAQHQYCTLAHWQVLMCSERVC